MTTIHQDWFDFLNALRSENTKFLLIGAHARVFMLGVKPWRIDILAGIDGVSFEEAWRTRQPASFHGIELFVIGRDALLKNKRASGRKKDLVDVALLEESGDGS
jgi:hypothetical protein